MRNSSYSDELCVLYTYYLYLRCISLVLGEDKTWYASVVCVFSNTLFINAYSAGIYGHDFGYWYSCQPRVRIWAFLAISLRLYFFLSYMLTSFPITHHLNLKSHVLAIRIQLRSFYLLGVYGPWKSSESLLH